MRPSISVESGTLFDALRQHCRALLEERQAAFAALSESRTGSCGPFDRDLLTRYREASDRQSTAQAVLLDYLDMYIHEVRQRNGHGT